MGQGHWVMMHLNIKDNNFARFHIQSYHCCRETNYNSRLDTKISIKSVELEI